MDPAAAEFAARLARSRLAQPRAVLICNLTGAAVRQPPELARCLWGQMANTVLWDTCMESLAERGVRCVLEVGPGTTLSKMWRSAWPDIPVRSVDEFRSVEAVAAWVGQALR